MLLPVSVMRPICSFLAVFSLQKLGNKLFFLFFSNNLVNFCFKKYFLWAGEGVVCEGGEGGARGCGEDQEDTGGRGYYSHR